MKFPYMELTFGSSPIIPVDLEAEKRTRVLAYVDSGATYSIFSHEICTVIGLDLKDGEKVYITVGDGGSIPVFIHPVKIRVGEIKFEAKVGFSEKLGIGVNILERRTVFDRFFICFNDKDRYLTIEEI
ncbi:MAG: hypothetical protein JSW28_10485 [Thermoplasmata archaeon]|nr:MAG: hypothetical protein JSW28_10485 [Thermoplasmata archaeon]